MKCHKIVFTMEDEEKMWDVPIDLSKDLLIGFEVSDVLLADEGSEKIIISITKVSDRAKSFYRYLNMFRGM